MSQLKDFIQSQLFGNPNMDRKKIDHRRPAQKGSPLWDLLENYPGLREGLETVALEPLRAKEQVRRQQQYMEEFQQKVSEEIARKDDQIKDLMQRIKVLSFRPDPLTDEEVTRKMKALQHRLEKWVNAHFLNENTLDTMSKLLEANGAVFVPKGLHEVRAFIISTISATIYEHIFGSFLLGSFMFGIEEAQFGAIVKAIQNNCPSYVAHNWRTATSIGISAESRDSRKSSERFARFVEECMKFKQCLDRQESQYRFFRSTFGTSYDPEKMEQATGTCGDLVVFSIWPGLYKESDLSLYKPEVVWVRSTETEEQPGGLPLQEDELANFLIPEGSHEAERSHSG
ncbi:hypothetical protein BO71DRAFT_429005 [Aspergillus ellipticus CBS 707.79]|uniref:Uncharacterized protein n=1 Tax=Aspergillus ellipticus CBS 707.79 TaxID=1448320 RepID=A0A319DDQ9_9EURO|nr:hypothetical protein BO71DRAFT_429005 [Aspergillus ellipticus CBS 707.79]